MKVKRLQKIIEIIENHSVCTQEDLLALLESEGIKTTQATISRDIKELNLVKTTSEKGGYKYTTAKKSKNQHMEKKYRAVFIESVLSADYAMNTVVIKCHTGMANAACAALDTMDFNGIVGTLAGDDTIIIVTTGEKQSALLVENLTKLL